MPLRLYNTLSRQTETFVPLDASAKQVSFYTCGPTVYDYAHIGNFRSFLNADLLRRTLELLGHHVTHVMNITDVGHMTDDAAPDGGGEDKMAEARRRLLESKKSGQLPTEATDINPDDPHAIADYYADAFLEDARTLGLTVAIKAKQHPEIMPRPTQFIAQMINSIKRLIERGHAYVAADGVVYFDVRSFPEYGRLSGNTLDQLRAGAGGRVSEQNQSAKRHPADFMLWKPDEKHIMKWNSPWGWGYPGWHLECSVMAHELLGQPHDGVIDLHSGGEDNIFPHHECEIAQSCGMTGHERFARYWFHTRHLMVEGEKMSKSRGNFYTLRDLLERGASPAAIRLELTRTHYRSNANFTFQGLKDAQRMIDRWMRLATWLGEPGTSAIASTGPMADAHKRFTESLCDDLNVAGAIAAINEALPSYDISGDPNDLADRPGDAAALRSMLRTLGILDLEQSAIGDSNEAAMIEAKLAERLEARRAKDFATADRIRDELSELGIAIKDGPEGTTWERVVQDHAR